jgi:predicted nuclease of predicted toxin-antitoxin system
MINTKSRTVLLDRSVGSIMIPTELAEALRAQGYDVAEARLLPPEVRQNDESLLEEAAREERVVVTVITAIHKAISV